MLECGLVIVKPSCSSSEKFIRRVAEILSGHSVKVLQSGSISGSEMKSKNSVEALFGTLSRQAHSERAVDVNLSPEGVRKFETYFGISWKEAQRRGRVFSMRSFQKEHSLENAVQVEELCSRSRRPHCRLEAALHCAMVDHTCTDDLELQDRLHEPVYVINGFYGALKAAYESPLASIVFMKVEWDGDKLSWPEVHNLVVGSRDPSLANPSSIRGTALREWKRLGLPRPPTRYDNCVHLAESAFAALVDRVAVLPNTQIYTDPMGSALIHAQVPSSAVQRWISNPVIGDRRVLDRFRWLRTADCIKEARDIMDAAKSRRAELIKKLQEKEGNESKTPSAKIESHPTLPLPSPLPSPHSPPLPLSPIPLDQPPSPFPSPPSSLSPLAAAPATSDRARAAKEQAFLFLKPRAATSELLLLVKKKLSESDISILLSGEVSGKDMASSGIFDAQYASLRSFAEEVDPLDIEVSQDMARLFRSTFNASWESVRSTSQLSNARDACEFLDVTATKLHFLCLHSKLSTVRLRRGLYVSCLDASSTGDVDLKRKLQLPIYVINGFYGSMKESFEAPTTRISYMLVEWDSSRLSWRDMMQQVIGDRVPSLAVKTSIRGVAYSEWQSLRLDTQPNSKDNCVHVSASSLEALMEKGLWLGNRPTSAELEADPLGSQFVAHIGCQLLQKWLQNPSVDGIMVFDHMFGMGIAQCIEKAVALTGEKNSFKTIIYVYVPYDYVI